MSNKYPSSQRHYERYGVIVFTTLEREALEVEAFFRGVASTVIWQHWVCRIKS